uniref:Reverse transcriptase domain-containing protein n=1 Tax=Clytia hemisphaerica TaxID=252671 RepID=A0A7M5UNA8_9CNID
MPYTCIPRKWLFDSISLRFRNSQSPILLKILEKLYHHTSLLYEGKVFATTSGVRQGGPESPFLFNLYIDFVMRLMIEKSRNDPLIQFFVHKYCINSHSISRNERVIMREKGLSSSGTSLLPWCGYADDLVLFLQSKTGLQSATVLLNEVFTKFGLSINSQKTETMILNHPDEIPYPSSIIDLGESQLSNVSDFKYLGAYLNSNQPNTGKKEITHRIQLASAKSSQMSNLLQNFHLKLKTRVLFLNCFVRSRLVYACQNWNLNQEQFDRLDVAYRKFLRRMVRGGFRFVNENQNDYRFSINNAQLHRICGTSDVSYFIKSQQHHYAAHVIRMPSSRSLKLLTFNDDQYTRRGRPAKSLLDQVVGHKIISISQFCSLALSKK